ncbi:MAG TPA: branched-chain amino acid aminotransferase [Rhizomicrobium sp.]|jgi:branched-chain amino acid aminotransferase|nr:branched-chain amino acid aminotransferase [Rhizomicrobium sp.]
MADVIPFDQRDGSLWYDGELIPWKDAKTHVLTHGLHYGSSVFEGERIYNGKIYKLKEHTARLFFSAETLGMKIPFTQDEINAACIAAAEAQDIKDGYIRPVAFRGSEMMAVSAQNTKIHVAIACWPWPSYFSPEEKLKGIRLDISKWRRPSPETEPVHAKAAGLYMICTLSKHEAESKGYADALMLDYRGYVAEATGANIFFVKDGSLHTPTPDCFLNGLTRQSVIAIAKERQVPVIERHIKPEEMSEFSECFLTGSAAEVTPVSEIGTYRFKPGKLTEMLMNAYADEVRGIKVPA